MNISILLPFKENYTHNDAGAVSLFVNDITRESAYKKSITVYGSTYYKKYLSSNYKNIRFNKNLLQSSNYQYVSNFINIDEVLNSDLIEVHNRPIYIKQIRKNFSKKLFLYFHNDPLSMSGSETVLERMYLLKTVDKLIFNSKWCRDKYFINLDNKIELLNKTTICFQSASKTKVNFKEKKKNHIFRWKVK